MTPSADRPTARREFLGQLATSAAVLAGTACAAPIAAASATTSPQSPVAAPAGAPQSATQWDDSWFARVTAKHKGMFDAAETMDGAVVGHAMRYISGMREALGAGDGDVQAVLVIRHSAIPMAFNDAMWAKYEIGKDRKIKIGDDWATRNPWLGANRANSDRPAASLAWFAAHGHILLGCGVAAQGQAGMIASTRGLDTKTVFEELKANLVPGLILQPNGIYAVHRAQEAGCTYIKTA